jgi:L-ascorbate metabolism protein UlaG (beta-lactamase superfamily)
LRVSGPPKHGDAAPRLQHLDTPRSSSPPEKRSSFAPNLRRWKVRRLIDFLMRPVFLLLLSIQPLIAGLDRYSSLILADPPNRRSPNDSIRITYLGTNGYQFETSGRALLVDPYFSRINLVRAGLGWPLRPDISRISDGLTHVADKVDAIVITHGHFDHLLDAPTIMQRTGARLIGSRTAMNIAVRAGALPNRCDSVGPGKIRNIGPWHIAVFAASHDRVPILGVPFNGAPRTARPPRRAADWVCGEPLSYIIVANGSTIYIDSGGTPAVLPPEQVAPVDLAILGVALPDSRARFAAAVRRLRPRYVLPSHQDNFFGPLARGFQFNSLTDFPFVLHESKQLPGRLMLLNYFRPWTLPTK